MLTAEYLKVLSDTNSLRIVNLLLRNRLCVCELEAITDLKQSNLSRHLSKLSKAGLITRTKEAQWVYYGISNDFIADHILLLDYLKIQFESEQIFIDDSLRFQLFQDSGISCNNINERVEILNGK